MDGKSKLPTMIKKPVFRSNVPSDRLIQSHSLTTGLNKLSIAKPNVSNRSVLTQNFENVLNMLQSTTNNKRPTKRHASPEFRLKSHLITNKKIRRSRSVSDIDAMFPRMAARRAVNTFALPNIPPLKVKTIATQKINATKPNVLSTSVNKKAPVTMSATVTAKKKDEPIKVNVPKANVKRIPAYDFKARFHDLNDKHKILKDKHDELTTRLAKFDTLPEQYDECKQKLQNLEIEYKQMQQQLNALQVQTSADQLQIKTLNEEYGAKIKALNDDLTAKIQECQQITNEKMQITEKYANASNEIDGLKQSIDKMKMDKIADIDTIDKLNLELQEAREQLYRANVDRKELHNTIMDLRGNIRVFCRVRPSLDTELNRTICLWQYNDETSLEISSVEVNKKPVKHEFNFDQVFRSNSQQEDIFEQVSPLVQSALDGFNICIFAYGQTGSGKTFTMDGTSESAGIIPRTIDFLFECFEQNRKLGWEYSLSVSCLEIYNEILFDLLSNEAKDLDIRMVSAKTPMEIFVSNLTDVNVQNKNDLHKLIELAKMNRATAATVGNERSSRSHSVTQLRLCGTHAVKNEMTVSTINLIDLAGSESPKTSIRMEETKKINKSLSELTNVIMALLQKQDHIPYRNSKLTHLLMPSLGGNSKTLMFVNVSPFQDCFIETVKSLRFAASVNSCKMNKAKKNKYYPTPTAL